MNSLREAAQQALDWFEWLHSGQPDHMASIDTDGVRQSLRAALAEPEQEPIAWANPNDLQNFDMKVRTNGGPLHTVPLYTAPQPAKRVPLTDETLWEMWVESPSDVLRFAHAIERAHGIGEQA